jgi:hypothetical protein
MTREEAVYEILEIIRGNQLSDDIDIDTREVEFQLDNARAVFLRQEFNKPGRLIDNNLVQDLGCVTLEEADPADCCEIDTGCSILRTVEEIPKAIHLFDGPAITRVGPVNKMNIKYSFVSYEQAVFSGNGKYNQQAIFAFLLNNRIYLTTKNKKAWLLDKINIRGVFEKPSEASEFVDCDNNPCYTMASNYPINNWMYPFIRDMVLEKYGISLKMPKDNTNNADDVKIGK